MTNLFDIAVEKLADEISGFFPTEEEIEYFICDWLTDQLKEFSGGKTLIDAYLEDFDNFIEELEKTVEINDCYFKSWWGWLDEMERESF